MGWKDWLKKINLAEIKGSLKTEQAGVINFKVENKTYNFNIHDPKAVKSFQQIELSPELEGEIKLNAEKRLAPIEDYLDMLNEETAGEVVVASTTLSSFDTAKKWLEEVSKKKDKE